MPSERAAFDKAESARPDHEARLLRLVAGRGVVPLVDQRDDTLTLAAARCSIADVVLERGRLSAAETRGVIIAAAHALARCHAEGIVHGDVKPANLLLTDDGELWLADFDAAGSSGDERTHHSPGRGASAVLDPADDIRALLSTALECAVGHLVDPSVAWSALQLAQLGCPADLAAELAVALRRAPDAAAIAGLFAADDATLPTPSVPNQADRTPTIEFSLDDRA